LSIEKHFLEPLQIHDGDFQTRSSTMDHLLEEAKKKLAAGEYDAAEEILVDARNWNPGSFRLWQLWAELHSAQENLEKQVFALETAVAFCSDTKIVSEMMALLGELTGRSYEYCDRCGQVGSMKSYYQLDLDKVKCPRCLGKSKQQKQGFTVSKYGMILLGLILVGPATLPFGGWMFANLMSSLVLIFVFMFVLIPAHELAHILAALVLRGRVMRVQIGLGPKMADFEFRNTKIRLHWYILIGLVYLGFPTRRNIRLRSYVATAAGPLFHLILLLVFWQGTHWDDLVNAIGWRASFMAANILLLISSGLPFGKADVLTGYIPDGMKMMDILKNQLTTNILHLSNFFMGGILAAQDGDIRKAVAEFEDGLVHYPDSRILKLNLAVWRASLGRYEEAAESLNKLKADLLKQVETGRDSDLQMPEELTLLYVSNAAAYFESLEEVSSYNPQNSVAVSLENYRQAPWQPGVASTLGTGLVALGYPAEGLMYLEFSYRHPVDPEQKTVSESNAWIAVALHRLGRTAKARKVLDQFPEDPGENRVIRWAIAEIEGTASG
jgi:tetratricopeptide (TPR) repeat protein